MTHDEIWRTLLAIGRTWEANSGGRLRIAINEQDETTKPDPEAQEHIKIDGKRVGRDFRLYGFMADVAGVPTAVTDFADIILYVKVKLPEAYAAGRQQVLDLESCFTPAQRELWKELW